MPRLPPIGQDIDRKPNPVDVHVGSRVRLRRTLLGMTQEMLGDALGLTFQQVQKYERGANRIGASRLFDLSRELNVPIGYFFDSMPPDIDRDFPSLAQPDLPFYASGDEALKRETLELVRAYYSITDPATRRRIYNLAKALG